MRLFFATALMLNAFNEKKAEGKPSAFAKIVKIFSFVAFFA